MAGRETRVSTPCAAPPPQAGFAPRQPLDTVTALNCRPYEFSMAVVELRQGKRSLAITWPLRPSQFAVDLLRRPFSD
jgi:hypothetical protein